MKEMTSIFFQALAEPDFHDFRNEVKEVFSIAIAEHFGLSRDGNFFEDDDIDGMLRDPKSAVYAIYVDGRRAGGVALHIDPESRRNRMDLFYFYPGFHNQGLGGCVWKMIEEMYPETVVWELFTPYFEKRNIHFYVNKCGFRIVEFFCRHHADPAVKQQPEPFHNEYFRFEKQMKV